MNDIRTLGLLALSGQQSQQPSPFRYKQVIFGLDTAPQHWVEARSKAFTYRVIPRFLHWVWAGLCGYYWLPCGICKRPYGGHENCWASDLKGHGACPDCAVNGKAFTTETILTLPEGSKVSL